MTYKTNGVILVFFLISTASFAKDMHLASIEKLVEQEIGRIVIGQIYDSLKVDYTVKPLPGKRAAMELKRGDVDGEIMRIYSYGKNNPNVVRVATPYYSLETMPFYKVGNNKKINSMNELCHFRIAIIRGVRHTADITKNCSKVIKLNNTEQAMRFVLKGRADIALTNTIDGLKVLKTHHINNITHSEQPLKTEALYHYLHKKHKAFASVIDNKILELMKNGKLNRIIKDAEFAVIQ